MSAPQAATVPGSGVLALPQPWFRQHPPAPAALAHMLVDPVVAVGSLLACLVGSGIPFDGPYRILALLVLLLAFVARAGAPAATTAEPLRHVAGRWLVIVALLLLVGWTSGTLDAFDRHAMLVWLAATPLAQLAAHRLATDVLARVLSAEGVQRRAVIAGANDIGRRLADRIQSNPCLGIRVIGYFDDREPGRLGDIGRAQLLGPLAGLAEFAKRRRVDVIYSALPMCPQPRIRELLESLRDTTASIYFVPDIFLCDLIQARVDTIGGIPVLAVRESPCHGLTALFKRVVDVLFASVILAAAAPLLLAIAAAVSWSSPGPVLFCQRRYGLDGREIVVYKFRTMTCLEDGDRVTQATVDDPRTTRIGAFLRKYSLDEFPQFVNVIQGRMSVVGPRPHAVAHNELYRKLIPDYMFRHKVKPGITGLAQVNGLRGETDTLDKMRARIECDLDYLRNWSFLLDVRIILRTIAVIWRRKNAY
ncbi:MAG: undecaprenyl-phosphate glucose phosphotransferase [Steroidobacteraceae bacterium]